MGFSVPSANQDLNLTLTTHSLCPPLSLPGYSCRMGEGVPTSGVAGKLSQRPAPCAGPVCSVLGQAGRAAGLWVDASPDSAQPPPIGAGAAGGATTGRAGVVGGGPGGAGRRGGPRPAGSCRLGAPGEPAAPLPTFMLAVPVPPSVQAEEVSPGRAGCPGRRGRRQEAMGTTGN